MEKPPWLRTREESTPGHWADGDEEDKARHPGRGHEAGGLQCLCRGPGVPPGTQQEQGHILFLLPRSAALMYGSQRLAKEILAGSFSHLVLSLDISHQ